MSLIHRREKIIYRAIDVINELGVQALSTKRIAQHEHIAESTIFKHFKSKTEILAAVIDFYSQYDSDLEESIQIKGLKGVEALLFLTQSHVRYYENYPAITSITQGLDEMRYIEGLSDKVIEVINKRRSCVRKIIEEGIALGEISQAYDSTTFVDAIMGSINGIVRRWRMEAYSFGLSDQCMKAISMILRISN